MYFGYQCVVGSLSVVLLKRPNSIRWIKTHLQDESDATYALQIKRKIAHN